jgi:thiol-disulfide isomerase/thioredoxin
LSIKSLFTTIAAVGFSFALAAFAAGDDAAQPSPLVNDLLTALDQAGKIPALINNLEQKLAKPGPEADQLAAEVLRSMEQVERRPEVCKYVSALVEAKKERLAAQLLLRIRRAQTLGGGWGRLVIGQLVVEDGKIDPELVMSQMPILEEGYFADVVKSFDQPLSFRAHGYRDLDVPLTDAKSGAAILEKVVLQPLPPGERATLKGTVVLDGSSDAKSAQVIVKPSMGPINTPSGGYSPRMRWPEGVKVPVSESGEFTVEGLNPSDISVSAIAADHINQFKKIKLTSEHPTDIGELRLLKTDLGFYVGSSAPEGELHWESDYASALKRAEAEQKPLMVMMTATWCGPCKMLEKETLNDPWIRSFLSKFVIVKAYEDKDVEKKYGMSGYPTLVFTDPSGNQAYKCVGHKPAFEFVQDCARAFESLAIEQPEAIKKLIEKKIITLK